MPLEPSDLAQINEIVVRAVRAALPGGASCPTTPALPRMTVDAFARAVDRKPQTILKMIRQGRIPSRFVDRGRPFRISAGALSLFNVTAQEAQSALTTGAGDRTWKKVSFAADATSEGNCSICGQEYGECPCPGPTQEGYEYKEIKGELYARLSAP